MHRPRGTRKNCSKKRLVSNLNSKSKGTFEKAPPTQLKKDQKISGDRTP